MPKQIDNIVEKFLNEILNLLGDRMKKAILFGSYARGDFDKNSDVDIMILTDLSDDELVKYRTKIRDIACDIEEEHNIIISPIVKNIEKYNARTNVIPFYINIKKEGVVLHG